MNTESGAGELLGHSGELALAALEPWGVGEVFTLSGGHIFPFLDACHTRGLRLVDVRHEQTATFAAEGTAKLTRRPGVAALTAGPGVTNGISAITTAHFNGSPVVVLGGRAAQGRWGSGSLQEIDHLPLVDSITKHAATIMSPDDVYAGVARAAEIAATPARGPVFVDVPIDVAFAQGKGAGVALPPRRGGTPVVPGPDPDPEAISEAADLLARAARPVLIAGGDVWLGAAEGALATLIEEIGIPAFTNGQGRGCLAADHPLALSRVRAACKEADVVLVVGTPLDFRLSFGHFGGAQVTHLVDAPGKGALHASPAVTVTGDLSTALEEIASAAAGLAAEREVDRKAWVDDLRDREQRARAEEVPLLQSRTDPIHPMRVLGELIGQLDRDAVVIGDGGDFVSFAGKVIPSYTPGCWLDPGPYGCLGTGLGYLIAARLAHPGRQVVGLFGDGAFGFSAIDVDTLVRHELAVVMVVGNNGIWALEKHPMRSLYGYDVAADLQAGCRYDAVVEALGGAGETVSDPEEIAPALARAFASGVPYLVNVLTDPDAVYPRSSNLA